MNMSSFENIAWFGNASPLDDTSLSEEAAFVQTVKQIADDRPLRAAIIGFGKVGAGYVDDPVMARHYPFATHAQTFAAHPAFDWQGVVDPSASARDTARTRWNIAHVAPTVAELAHVYSPQVAVLATPPDTRLALLSHLPDLRAVLVEKPLGETLAQGQAFVAECERRNILVQVNLWRRADAQFERLANGLLNELVGDIQAVFGLYGNGLRNNGTHLIDFTRMLFGEIEQASVVPNAPVTPTGPLMGDVNISFTLRFASGLIAVCQPLDFTHYRENSLDIWGTRGRVSIMQEGLGLYVYPRCPHRATQGAGEIASDCPDTLPSTVGHAFYRMADNLANALLYDAPLCSPAPSALRTMALVEDVMRQAGERV